VVGEAEPVVAGLSLRARALKGFVRCHERSAETPVLIGEIQTMPTRRPAMSVRVVWFLERHDVGQLDADTSTNVSTPTARSNEI